MQTTITFIGSADVLPEVGKETASFVINGRHLVDCGWNVALEMRRYQLSPLDLETLFITHCHHDHVMGLPALLFFRGMRRSQLASTPLHIYGPVEEMPDAVENARRFLRADRFPEIWPDIELHPLLPGDKAETNEYKLSVERAQHDVPALAYRFEDKATGSIVAFTGDTGYKPDLATFAQYADLLIHEAFRSPDSVPGPAHGHSSPVDAARIAQAAEVKQLALIHFRPVTGPQWLEAAQQIFPETILAEEGLVAKL